MCCQIAAGRNPAEPRRHRSKFKARRQRRLGSLKHTQAGLGSAERRLGLVRRPPCLGPGERSQDPGHGKSVEGRGASSWLPRTSDAQVLVPPLHPGADAAAAALGA
eukprot:CAMPEP_0168381828 /NCGR_PEP_ID=MMETSP0228-20121227/13076_1 /TAXON_ID=133427 /ORGANISM="Protoceratium reticulatum, Strain CCCM 535 (=CCMP 1889)" /LENGTH=105 /DNA_ID=CAMNT_0008394935 /DNA_START=22 /DNA_END=336 /DNA_ORIENTATION=+